MLTFGTDLGFATFQVRSNRCFHCDEIANKCAGRSALVFNHQVCYDPRSLLKTRMSRINRNVIM